MKLLPLCVLMTAVATCVTSQSTTKGPRPTKAAPDIESVLSKKPHYSMLLDLLRSSGLLNTLKNINNPPGMTLFAPTNLALSSIPDADFNALKNDMSRLGALLEYHVANEAFHTSKRANDKTLTSMLKGLPIRFNIYNLMHTMSAEGVNITESDIRVANGFVQGIDGVMMEPKGDIVELINNNPNTTVLAKLIAASGLGPAISADSNQTLFAPTDAAFSHLDDQALTYLQNNADALKQVLLYHLVPKTTLYSIGMRHAMTFETADSAGHHDFNNLMLIEDPNNDNVYLNHAKVTKADISATNGVIHLLDDVLVPTDVLIQIEDQGLHLG